MDGDKVFCPVIKDRCGAPQVDAGSLAPIQDRERNEESVAKDETLPKEV